MKQKKDKLSRKRVQKRNKIKNKCFKIFGINSAGIKSKLKSFNDILKKIQPKIWMVQETKLKPHEKISCALINEFQVYYLNRQGMQGGGVALGVSKDLESTLIKEGNDETEVLSVKVLLEEIPVRAIAAYGPQENAPMEKKNKFWEFLETEVNDAEIEGDGLIIQMDGNLHAGSKLITNDPNKQNTNGRLFCEFFGKESSAHISKYFRFMRGVNNKKKGIRKQNRGSHFGFLYCE